MNRYRLLVGTHIENNTVMEKDPSTGFMSPVCRPTVFNAKDPKRRIVESDKDLVAKFGREKFRKLGPVGVVDEDEEVLDEPGTANVRGRDTLESMSKKELREMANAEEIELGTNDSKDEMIERILSAVV